MSRRRSQSFSKQGQQQHRERVERQGGGSGGGLAQGVVYEPLIFRTLLSTRWRFSSTLGLKSTIDDVPPSPPLQVRSPGERGELLPGQGHALKERASASQLNGSSKPAVPPRTSSRRQAPQETAHAVRTDGRKDTDTEQGVRRRKESLSSRSKPKELSALITADATSTPKASSASAKPKLKPGVSSNQPTRSSPVPDSGPRNGDEHIEPTTRPPFTASAVAELPVKAVSEDQKDQDRSVTERVTKTEPPAEPKSHTLPDFNTKAEPPTGPESRASPEVPGTESSASPERPAAATATPSTKPTPAEDVITPGKAELPPRPSSPAQAVPAAKIQPTNGQSPVPPRKADPPSKQSSTAKVKPPSKPETAKKSTSATKSKPSTTTKPCPPPSPLIPPITLPILKKPKGAKCVRFGDTTIHTVEVHPGRHLTPIGPKQFKTKSGLTYLNPPADPKKGRKVVVEFPPGKVGRLRRHRERQAAMERYWLRTEEEEKAEREEAMRRAEEEMGRYREEPSSPFGSPCPERGGDGFPCLERDCVKVSDAGDGDRARSDEGKDEQTAETVDGLQDGDRALSVMVVPVQAWGLGLSVVKEQTVEKATVTVEEQDETPHKEEAVSRMNEDIKKAVEEPVAMAVPGPPVATTPGSGGTPSGDTLPVVEN